MLARLLDLRPGESRSLLLLGGHFFLLLAATTLLGTAAEAVFLTVHPYAWTPYTYIIGAAASVVGALAYGRLGLGRRPPAVSRVTMIVLTALVLALCLLVRVWPAAGAFALMGLTPVFGVGAGMESAALVTRTLDSRQARRLYPAISGIGGVGATCGALLATGLSYAFGPLGAAACAGGFLLAALVPALRVPARAQPGRGGRRAVTPVPWREMFRNRFSVSLVVLVSLAGVLSTCAKYVLKASVQESMPSAEIGPYLGQLYAVLNAVSIVFGFLITRRIVARFGLGVALLVYPSLLAFMGVGGLMMPGLVMGSATLFSERLFRQNMQKPLLHIATMPLSPDLAARTNVAVRGAVETPAVVLTSLALLVIGAALPWNAAFWIIAVAGTLGAVAALSVRRNYGKELVAALRSRRLQTDQVRDAPLVLDAAARALLHTRLESETPERAALAAQLLRGYANRQTLVRIERRWPHWPSWVRAGAIQALGLDPPPGAGAFISSLGEDEPPEVHVARLRVAGWTPPTDALGRWLDGGDPRVAGAAATRALETPLAERAEALVADWLSSPDAAWRAAAIGVLAARGTPDDVARILAHPAAAPREILVAAAGRSMPALAPLCVAHLADEQLEPLARAALLRVGEAALQPLAEALHGGAACAAACDLLLALGVPEARTRVFDALLATDARMSFDAARALWRRRVVPNTGERQGIEHTLERVCADCERFGVARGAADERVARQAAVRLEAALERFFLLLSLLEPERAYRRMQLSLSSGDSRERSFAVEGLDELLDAPWRARMLPLLDSSPPGNAEGIAHAIRSDPELSRIAEAASSGAPRTRIALQLEAADPFRGMAFTDLEAVAEQILAAAEDPAVEHPEFLVRGAAAIGLDAALRGEPVSEPAAREDLHVPLACVWPVLATSPHAGRQWLRNLAAQWAAPPPDGPDISHSGVSLASDPGPQAHEVTQDLSIWQRVFYLRLVPLSAALPPHRLRLLAEICRLLRVRAGQRVIHAARPAGHAYVICSGTFDVIVGGRPVDELGEGEAFGLLALLSGHSHPGTVSARAEGEVLAIDRVDFHDLLATHPGFVRSLSRWTAQRALAVAGA